MLKWKRKWLETHDTVTEYMKKEEIDPVGLGLPFNWIMDMISTVEKHLRREEEKEKEKEEQEEKRKHITVTDLVNETMGKFLTSKEFTNYPYREPEEPNPYHGTYSEE